MIKQKIKTKFMTLVAPLTPFKYKLNTLYSYALYLFKMEHKLKMKQLENSVSGSLDILFDIPPKVKAQRYIAEMNKKNKINELYLKLIRQL